MRKVALMVVAVCALAILCSGCGTLSREVAYHEGVKEYAIKSGLLDEYDKYLEADPNLADTTKTIRKQSSEGLRALIAAEEAAIKEEEEE